MLFEQDQQDRTPGLNGPIITSEVDKRDGLRLEETYKILNSGVALSAKDKYHAAMILQHGDKSDDYRVANQLCEECLMAAGFEPARWLYAASLDRYLGSQGKPQKFGTQFKKVRNRWTLWKIDPGTTDEERANYNVPPISR